MAVTKAFLAVNAGQGTASTRIREPVAGRTAAIVGAMPRRQPQGGSFRFHIEDIQERIELALMRSGGRDVARAHVPCRGESTHRNFGSDPVNTIKLETPRCLATPLREELRGLLAEAAKLFSRASEMVVAKKKRSFFATRVVEYRIEGAPSRN